MNMNALMKQAQQMQKKMAEAEKAIEASTYTFSMNQGAIQLEMQGNLVIKRIEIDKDLLDVESKEMLEDMLIVALNDCIADVLAKKEETMQAITGNVKIPGM